MVQRERAVWGFKKLGELDALYCSTTGSGMLMPSEVPVLKLVGVIVGIPAAEAASNRVCDIPKPEGPSK
jgi:hypothetical protein